MLPILSMDSVLQCDVWQAEAPSVPPLNSASTEGGTDELVLYFLVSSEMLNTTRDIQLVLRTEP